MTMLTEIPHLVSDQDYDYENPSDKGPECYNSPVTYAPTMTNPERNNKTFYSQQKGYTQKHPQYRQAPADRILLYKNRKRK